MGLIFKGKEKKKDQSAHKLSDPGQHCLQISQ